MSLNREKDWSLTPYESQYYQKWLVENMDIFRAWALQGFEKHGRGAIFIDVRKLEEFRPLILYAPLEHIKLQTEQQKILSIVKEYNPSHELVVVITREADQPHSALKLTLSPPPNQPNWAEL